MIECSRKIDFDAGHRVIGHKNKCQYLHGHRYSLEITATALELDELGMVADFVVLKKIMKKVILLGGNFSGGIEKMNKRKVFN